MENASAFKPLSVDSLAARLSGISALTQRIGSETEKWRVREVGDGNLNLVFIVEGSQGSAIVKQALPYVRLVGDSWPLPLKRSFFEFHALKRQAERDPGKVPEIYYFDELQALIVMEFLSPHIILRKALIEGQILPHIARDLGLFAARTLFRGSDLSLDAATRKNDLGLFSGNVELCDITENLVFTDPYFEAEMNRHTSPQLDEVVAQLRADRDLKVEAQILKAKFTSCAETLVHGDLHTGSVMVTSEDTRVIDPEFAFYGPMAFDVGMLLGNFWTAYFSQAGHEGDGSRDAMRSHLLSVCEEVWTTFTDEFARLWQTERSGMLYPRSLFEDQGDELGAHQALDRMLNEIWRDMLGYAGVEMHRRILGLAHNAEFETIEDADVRARCEAKALAMGRHLAVNRHAIHSISQVNALAQQIEKRHLP
ncbi:MAG: S-methyl-5-thioribose kinase [Mesorhizobium sp.]|nr:S-methyl-5-thioribose kinase [Mesorhizobium sp.]